MVEADPQEGAVLSIEALREALELVNRPAVDYLVHRWQDLAEHVPGGAVSWHTSATILGAPVREVPELLLPGQVMPVPSCEVRAHGPTVAGLRAAARALPDTEEWVEVQTFMQWPAVCGAMVQQPRQSLLGDIEISPCRGQMLAVVGKMSGQEARRCTSCGRIEFPELLP